MIRIRSANEKKLVIEDSAHVMAAMFWLLFGFMLVLFALLLLTGQSPVPRNPASTLLAIVAVGVVGAAVGAGFTHVRRITFDRAADTLVIEDGTWLKLRAIRKYQLRDIQVAKLTTKAETVAVNPYDNQSSSDRRHGKTSRRNNARGSTRELNLYGVALQFDSDDGLLELNLNYGAWESAQSVINAINEIMMWQRYEDSDLIHSLDAETEDDGRKRKLDDGVGRKRKLDDDGRKRKSDDDGRKRKLDE
jgi:hypothetical protein